MFGKKPAQEPTQLIVTVSKSDSKTPSEPEVRAGKFVLTDSEGFPRAQLQCAGKGAVALTFHGGDGKMGLLIGLDPNGSPTLAMMKDGKVRAGIDLDKDKGHAQLTLKGPLDSKIEAGYSDPDRASLGLTDANGKLRVSINLDLQGGAEIKIYDKNGYAVSQLKPQ